MTPLTNEERETIITTNEASDEWDVYTYNRALMRYLAKFADDYPDICTLVHRDEEMDGEEYIVRKNTLKIRLVRPRTEAEREVMRQRALERGFGAKKEQEVGNG